MFSFFQTASLIRFSFYVRRKLAGVVDGDSGTEDAGFTLPSVQESSVAARVSERKTQEVRFFSTGISLWGYECNELSHIRYGLVPLFNRWSTMTSVPIAYEHSQFEAISID